MRIMPDKILFLVLLALSAVAPATVSAADNVPTAAAAGSAPVVVGDIAPDFTLEDQDGQARTLSAERGKRPVVLVFYRGYW